MIPRTWPQDADGNLVLQEVSPTGRVRWIDYIPVAVQPSPGTNKQFSTDYDGYMPVSFTEPADLVEWVTYIPAVTETWDGFDKAWQTSYEGYIPVSEGGSAPAPLVVTDDFNRANEALDASANWRDGVFFRSCGIVNNQVRGASGTNRFFPAMGVWIGDTFPNDQYAEATINADLSGVPAEAAGILVRFTGDGSGATEKCYFCVIQNTAVNQLQVFKFDRTSGTGILVLQGSVFSDGDTVRLEAVGSTLTVYVNGASVITTSDSEFTAGQPGVCVATNSIRVSVDNFEAGEV
jgi:hypothetical protein